MSSPGADRTAVDWSVDWMAITRESRLNSWRGCPGPRVAVIVFARSAPLPLLNEKLREKNLGLAFWVPEFYSSILVF